MGDVELQRQIPPPGDRLDLADDVDENAADPLRALAEKFPRNPVTGERLTVDAGYKSMWRWACRPENEKAAYHIFRKSPLGRDPEWTPERWHAELKEKARWALTKTQYRRWYA